MICFFFLIVTNFTAFKFIQFSSKNYILLKMIMIHQNFYWLFHLSRFVQGSGGSVNTMEEKGMSSTSDTMIDKIISFLRFIAAPMVKNTVRK